MSLRSRILLAFLIVVLVPAAITWFGARREIEERLRDQYRARVASLASVIEGDLVREDREIHRRLSALTDRLSADNRFRATADGVEDRAYLLDLAPEAMAITGLSMLQIHDPGGRIVSSGHFRNAFDVVAPELPEALSALRGVSALTTVRTPEGGFIGLVRVDSLRVGDTYYRVVGGRRVGEEFLSGLARDPELSVRLVHPGGVLRSRGAGGPARAGQAVSEVARAITIPFVGGTTGQPSSPSPSADPGQARFEIAFDGSVLEGIRRSTNLWFGFVLAGATTVSLLLAAWLSGRVTRPLRALASQARRVDLDRLDVPFPTGRRDEIGELSRVLKGMTQRIRAGARELRDAERRATLGELARQVNHDVRNGLVPIRNVFRHLDDVARDSPEQLPDVFRERRGSLASSVSYLESLAGNYSRLSRKAGPGSADAVSVSRRVVEGAAAESDVPVQMESKDDAAPVRGDAVTIRRIVENLVANAKDAVRDGGGARRTGGSRVRRTGADGVRRTGGGGAGSEGKRTGDLDGGDAHAHLGPGRVTVRVETSRPSKTVRIVVEDTGRGMSEEERTRAFEDFYTTREDGTGLGLPVVRRLVRDLGGEVRLESEEGRGTRVTVELPAGRDNGGSAGRPRRSDEPERSAERHRRQETGG